MARLKVRAKRPPPLEEPPSASSSSSSEEEEEVEKEEPTPPPKAPKPAAKEKQDDAVAQQQEQQQEAESEESDSGSDSDSEESEDNTPPKAPEPAPKTITQQQQQQQEAESEESDSGSDSDSDESEDTTPPKAPEPAPKTITQQQEEAESDQSGSGSGSEDEESEEELESEPKMAAVKSQQPTKSSKSPSVTGGGKRRVADTERSPAAKRAKKDTEESGEKSEAAKMKLLERRWSAEDEIALLEGVCEFTQKNGINLSKHMNAFHEFIKKSLHFDVTFIQLKDKIWRLKKKFDNNLVNGKMGEHKSFSKPHEQKLFDLSKKIWGNGGVESNVKGRISSNLMANRETLAPDLGMGMAEDKVGEMKIVDVTRSLSGKSFQEMADHMVKKGLEAVDGKKKAEMEEKWKELDAKGVELFLQRIMLVEEHTRLALASYKGS